MNHDKLYFKFTVICDNMLYNSHGLSKEIKVSRLKQYKD